MKMVSRMLALTAVFVLLVTAVSSAFAANETFQEYYDEIVEPLMDKIGSAMKSHYSSLSNLKNAFKNAEDAVEELKEACDKVSEYKNNSTLMNYLDQVETNVTEGAKYTEKVSSSNSTMLNYQQNAAKYLEKFKDCIEAIKPRLAGDASDNGSVNPYDAVVILKYKAGKSVTINKSNADVTGDGSVSTTDALRILQYAAGWNVTLK